MLKIIAIAAFVLVVAYIEWRLWVRHRDDGELREQLKDAGGRNVLANPTAALRRAHPFSSWERWWV